MTNQSTTKYQSFLSPKYIFDQETKILFIIVKVAYFLCVQIYLWIINK